MSVASAPRGRSLSRPGAQNLSLPLVEHPLFRSRTYGAYGAPTTATPLTSTPNDIDLSDMAIASARPRMNPNLLSVHPPTSACERGAGLTPLTAMTVDSMYSQDSWIEREDRCTERAVHLRVDTRRFAVALSPGIDLIFPSVFAASAASSSATTETETEPSLQSSPAAELRLDPKTLPGSVMAIDVPVIPDASKVNDEPADTQRQQRIIKRSPSMLRLRAQKFSKIFSRVNSISFSGNKRGTAVRETRDKRSISQSSPHDPLELDIVLDLRNDGESITPTEALDEAALLEQPDTFSQQEADVSTQGQPISLLCSMYLPSGIDFYDSRLPTIAVSPLAVTFDEAMDSAPQEFIDPYATTQWDPVVDFVGIAI